MPQPTIEINPTRVKFLLEMFHLSEGELLKRLNKGYKKKELNYQDVFTNTIQLSYLRKIDKIFKQGLSFYTDPINLSTEKRHSIFFRKKEFNAKPNLSDYQTISKIEKEISHLSVLTTLSNYPAIERTLPPYSINYCPQETAEKMRQKIHPGDRFEKDRDFLEALINNLGEKQVLVMEILEAPNRSEKMNIEGCFITPHYIAIKRQRPSLQRASNLQDDSFKREIFTLAHELGHYLLGEEELDRPVGQSQGTNGVERWCNTFAFAFLMGSENIAQLNEIKSPSLWDSQITKLSEENHVSRLALFTNLVINKRISRDFYGSIKKSLEEENERIQKKREAEREAERKRLEAQGKKPYGKPAQPIHSKLEKDIYRNAFFEGVIEEYEVLNHFKIKEGIDGFAYE